MVLTRRQAKMQNASAQSRSRPNRVSKHTTKTNGRKPKSKKKAVKQKATPAKTKRIQKQFRKPNKTKRSVKKLRTQQSGPSPLNGTHKKQTNGHRPSQLNGSGRVTKAVDQLNASNSKRVKRLPALDSENQTATLNSQNGTDKRNGTQAKPDPEQEGSSRYSFRKRIYKMKDNPSQFRERWGVPEPGEDSSLHGRLGRSLLSRIRRNRLSDDYEWTAWRGKHSRIRQNRGRRQPLPEIIDESDETDHDEQLRIENLHPCRYDMVLMHKLSGEYKPLVSMRNRIKCKIASLGKLFAFEQQQQLGRLKSDVPEQSVPVYADVCDFDWEALRKYQLECGGRLFDVVMMDPPWQLSSSQPSRGVAIGYSSLSDDAISRIPLPRLQKQGFLFIWVINAKYRLALELLDQWGYSLIDEIVWVKRTVTGKLAKGHGFYLQHSKETCLVGFKGKEAPFKSGGVGQLTGIPGDIIFSERRGQSQKPNEIYHIIENIVPNGFYLEIFGRRNNLRANWVTIGNEL